MKVLSSCSWVMSSYRTILAESRHVENDGQTHWEERRTMQGDEPADWVRVPKRGDPGRALALTNAELEALPWL